LTDDKPLNILQSLGREGQRENPVSFRRRGIRLFTELPLTVNARVRLPPELAGAVLVM
jgi:hypothetical protein